MQEAINPENQGLRDQRRQQIKNLNLSDEDISETILGIYKPKGFFAQAWDSSLEAFGIKNKILLPDAAAVGGARNKILNDYRTRYEAYFLSNGDEEVSKQLASTDIQSTYGVSTLSGVPRIMKYAPEKYYSVPGEDDKWMGEQVKKEIKKTFLVPMEEPSITETLTRAVLPAKAERQLEARGWFAGIKNLKYNLMADTITAEEVSAGTPPSYILYLEDDNGLLRTILDDYGKPLRMRFDNTEAKQRAKKKYNEAVENTLAKAKIEREELIK